MTWNVGDLNPGDTATVSVRVMGTTAGAMANTASATADRVPTAPQVQTTTTILVPAITVEKTGRTAIFVGQPGDLHADRDQLR